MNSFNPNDLKVYPKSPIKEYLLAYTLFPLAKIKLALFNTKSSAKQYTGAEVFLEKCFNAETMFLA